MLQFKSPWATFYGDNLYKFSINKKQHEALERLGTPDAVFYAFPLYSRWSKANMHAPDLLQDTWLLPVSCIPSGVLVRESNPIVVRRRNRSLVKVESDTYPYWEATCVAISAREHLEKDLQATTDRPRLIRVAQLKEWIGVPEIAALRFRNLEHILYTALVFENHISIFAPGIIRRQSITHAIGPTVWRISTWSLSPPGSFRLGIPATRKKRISLSSSRFGAQGSHQIQSLHRCSQAHRSSRAWM